MLQRNDTVSEKAKERFLASIKQLSTVKLKKLVNKAVAEQQWETSLAYFNELWLRDPNNSGALLGIAQILTKGHFRDKALDFIQTALETDGPSVHLLNIAGELAGNMKKYDLQERIFRIMIDLYPLEQAAWLGLAISLMNQDKNDIAISEISAYLEVNPDAAELWNILGLVVCNSRSPQESLVFIEEAIRLKPESYKFYDTLAFAKLDMGDSDGATAAWLKAKENCKDDNATLNFSLSIQYLTDGDLETGFPLYELRDHKDYANKVNYSLKAPRWDGKESLEGKSIMILNEQGVGDEFMFAAFFQFIVDQAEKVYIGAEPRLVELMQRSFPSATATQSLTTRSYGHTVRGYPDLEPDINDGKIKVDYSVMAATLPWYFLQKRREDLRNQKPYIQADPKRVKFWGKRMDKIGKKNMRIGVVWRSLTATSRHLRHYCDPLDWNDIFNMPNVDFYNLQIGEPEEQLKAIEKKFGIKVHNFNDIDLKQDLDDATALMQNLDLVIGIPTATLHQSSSTGVPTFWMERSRFAFHYGEDDYPTYPYAKMIYTPFDRPWSENIASTFEAIKEFKAEWKCPRK